MRLDYVSLERVEVVLSQRNIEALLSKVKREGSARTLEFEQIVEDEGHPDEIITLVVKAEPNDVHYGSRGFGPGVVHPADDPGIV